MSKSTNGLRKAGIASIATTLVLGAGYAGAGSASALPGFNFDRIGGADRYETSTLIADEFNETNADVILANGEPGSYADALTANYLAGEMNAPILLTRDDRTPDSVLAQLEEDGVQNIVVVGGESAINQSQVDALEGEGYTVTRVSGSDRFKTNAEVIEDGGQAENGLGLIATGFNFPDALAGGPLSYKGHPLGLSTQNDIDDEVIAALKAAGVNRVLILGGESAVGAAVVAKLAANEITVERRFAGSDRSETSELVAEYALAELGFTDEHVNVASGYVEGYGADALAGGPLTGKQNRPLLITKDVNQPDDVLDFLNAHDDTLIDGIIFGGNAAISVQAQAQMEEAAQGEVQSNQDYTVTPAGNQTVEAGSNQQFTVSGITSDTVEIELFDCSNVTTDENGVTTFEGTNPGGAGNVAQEDNAPTAEVTVVNGTAGGATTDADSSDGTVSFTVTTDAADAGSCYVAVVYNDADNDGRLDLGADGQPTEEFANSGDVQIIAAEAQDLAVPAGTVDWVDAGLNAFSNGTDTFYYDANDEFTVDGDVVTLAQFESVLSVADQITGTLYRTADANQSRFAINDVAPAEVTTLGQQAPSGDNAGKEGVELTWNESTTTTAASYTVYRTLANQPAITGQDVTCSSDLADYAQIGSVTDKNLGVDGDAAHVFFDGTANAPETTNGTDPSYCYAVVTVDETGDVSDPVFLGPVQADEAVEAPATAAPTFTAADASGTTIVVTYSENIDCTTVAANGSDFAANYTQSDNTTANNPTAALCEPTIDTDADNVLDATDQVTLTVADQPAGSTVVVRSRTGTDENTVGDLDDPQEFQVVGDAVQDTIPAA